MDPDAALKEIRELCRLCPTGASDPDDLERLVDLFIGLDEWLSKGGFLPKDWLKGR